MSDESAISRQAEAGADAKPRDSAATPLRDNLGPLAELLDDPAVIEISCNPTSETSAPVFVERFGADPEFWGTLDREIAERFVYWCATYAKMALTPATPILSTRIYGTAHRIEAVIPPVAEGPAFSIRRHSDRAVTLEEFVPDPEARRLILNALAARQNILIAGATGAGKTTLLNACLLAIAEMAPLSRLLTIEDTPEIRSPLANTIALKTSDAVTTDRLLVSALRLAPDRIVLGEVRAGAVLMTLLKAWHTGHPGGLVTIHANSGDDVLERMRLLAAEVTPVDQTRVLLAATDMVVFVRRGKSAPEVESVLARSGDPSAPGLFSRYANPLQRK